MPTTQASPAVGATRPLRRRAATRRRDFTPNAVSKRVRAKLMPLPSYQAYFSECCQGQALRARKRDLDRDRIPAFSKAGIQAIPLPATAATPLSPRRPPPPMRVGYADHAGVAGRRGYAPATQARCDEEEGLHTKRSLKRVRAKLMPLPSYHKRIFRSAVKVKPFGRASATLTEIEYPLLVKRVFKPSPSPPPRLRR